MTYREYWRATPGLLTFLLNATFKTLNARPASAAGMRRPDRLRFLGPEELPAEGVDALREPRAAFEAAGLIERFAFEPSLVVANSEGFVLVSSTDDGRIIGALSWSQTRVAGVEQVVTEASALTRLANGRWLTTSNGDRTLVCWSGEELDEDKDRSAAEVLAVHRRRLEAPPAPVAPIRPEDVRAAHVDRLCRIFDAYVARGLLVPMTAAEVDKIAELAAEMEPVEISAKNWLLLVFAVALAGFMIATEGWSIFRRPCSSHSSPSSACSACSWS